MTGRVDRQGSRAPDTTDSRPRLYRHQKPLHAVLPVCDLVVQPHLAHVANLTGFAIDLSTGWRYIHETVDLLATTADDAHTAAARAARLAYAILDATLIPIDRVAGEQPYYSGKHNRHGLNVQLLAGPRGNLVRASRPYPERCTT